MKKKVDPRMHQRELLERQLAESEKARRSWMEAHEAVSNLASAQEKKIARLTEELNKAAQLLEQRRNDLVAAIEGARPMPVPAEWLEELQEVQAWLASFRSKFSAAKNWPSSAKSW